MRVVFLCTLIIGCASAQYAKGGVKGGYGGQGYHAGENLVSLFGNRTQGTVHHQETVNSQNNVGVCVKEVPTVTLVKDPRHVPTGNGSRPDLSVIMTCCPGYERNIHNPRLCEPVCTQDCVNSICTAPEICTCYPDHVRNYAGVCVPTCPIGCQNGRCAGGECICNDGFILDRDSKYCTPTCRENCGGIGNCTGPNICSCRPGYQSTPEGSCKPVCDRCAHGDCVAPNECRCKQGYIKDSRGECISQCTRACGPTEVCVGPNTCAPATNLIPGQGPQQPSYQGSYPGYPGARNQTNSPYYPTHGPSQNSTFVHNRPDYPNRPSYPYPGQNSVNPDQTQYPNQYPNQYPHQYPNQYPNQYPSQYPGGSQPNYYVQPGGHGPYRPPESDNLLGNNSSTNVSRPYQPNQPGYPGYQPNQPGYQPNQPGYQPGFYPGFQPGFYPGHQPIYHPGLQPGQYPPHGFNQPNQTYPGYQPIYHPGLQPGQYPPHGFNQANQTYPGYMPNYFFQPGYYQPNLTFPNQYYQGQPVFRPGLYYQPMYPNPYLNNTAGGQYPFPYQGNTTSNQPGYPQPSYGSTPNVPSQPGSENLTSQQVYPSQHPSPNYNVPNNSYPTQGPYPTVEHTTNQSPLFNPYGQQNVCSPPCINGDCVGGNQCSCHRGYVFDHADATGNRCKPLCIGGCVHGVCSAPNVCVCEEGYYMDTSVKGRMICVKRIRRSVGQLTPKKPKSVVDF